VSPVLELSQITAYRGETKALDRLSLRLEAGEHTVILGPNGSGKSTLLKLLSREIYPVVEEGSGMRLFGEERWNVWDLRARLGLVSHELQHGYRGNVPGTDVVLSGLYASVGVWEHQSYSDVERERAQRIMTQLGIAELASRPFGKMSTGQQRRFLLARALIHEPDTLVLDEPTSGLDIAGCFQYMEFLRELMRAGRTVLLVTHHMHEIPPEVTRVVLLKGGRVAGDGPKRAVLTSERLSELFEASIRLIEADGHFQVVPGG